MTAAGAKFSEAIISRVDCWRWSSASRAAATSGSSSWRELLRSDIRVPIEVGGSVVGEGGVFLGGEQAVRLVRHLHLEQPAALEGGGVHQRRVVHHVLVDLGDLTGARRVQGADRLRC